MYKDFYIYFFYNCLLNNVLYWIVLCSEKHKSHLYLHVSILYSTIVLRFSICCSIISYRIHSTVLLSIFNCFYRDKQSYVCNKLENQVEALEGKLRVTHAIADQRDASIKDLQEKLATRDASLATLNDNLV